MVLRSEAFDLGVLRATVELSPAAPLLVPFHPLDLYPLRRDNDPLADDGWVEAAQRGVNTGSCYFHIDQPDFGTVL